MYTILLNITSKNCNQMIDGSYLAFFWLGKPYAFMGSFLVVNFTNQLFLQTLFQQIFSSYKYVEKAAETTMVQKICT